MEKAGNLFRFPACISERVLKMLSAREWHVMRYLRQMKSAYPGNTQHRAPGYADYVT